jgi:hypothetical protein
MANLVTLFGLVGFKSTTSVFRSTTSNAFFIETDLSLHNKGYNRTHDKDSKNTSPIDLCEKLKVPHLISFRQIVLVSMAHEQYSFVDCMTAFGRQALSHCSRLV